MAIFHSEIKNAPNNDARGKKHDASKIFFERLYQDDNRHRSLNASKNKWKELVDKLKNIHDDIRQTGSGGLPRQSRWIHYDAMLAILRSDRNVSRESYRIPCVLKIMVISTLVIVKMKLPKKEHQGANLVVHCLQHQHHQQHQKQERKRKHQQSDLDSV
ncbi:hypothetical protein BC941DRAFT_440225 [Chlamydoabsidia padenii]|nr:hypothetical protein BC941DRAFT_440225 [Chlamydoabsidia padenii]